MASSSLLLLPSRCCIVSFFAPIKVRVLGSSKRSIFSQRHFLKHMSSTVATAAAGGDPSSLPSSTEDGVGGGESRDSSDVLVQYVVLRRDLIDSWPLGSVVTQGCHASVAAIWSNRDDHLTLDYCSDRNLDSMHKVTLEVKGEQQILNLSEKLKEGGIVHKLWIEQPENIPTCLATKPYPKSAVFSFLKRLKLCK